MAGNRLPRPTTQSVDDLGAPSDFGSAAPPASPAGRAPTADEAPAAAGAVSPEHVHYHDDEQRCDMCANFGRGNQCAVLNIPVSPEGGCNAFQASGSDMGRDADPDADADVDTAGDTDDDYGV